MDLYSKYQHAFQDFDSIPSGIIDQVKMKIKQLEKGPVDVSIVVIAHNEEKRIFACISSLADISTNLSVEIIVVNNASTDGTQNILERSGVNIVQQPIKGFGYARQAGLDIARGKYLLTADSDTLYPPLYVETMVKELCAPGVSAVLGLYDFLPDGKKSASTLKMYAFVKNIIIRLKSIRIPELAVVGFCMGCYVENAKQVGYPTRLKRGEDGSMLIRQKPFGKIKLVTHHNARVQTTSRTLDSDGGLFLMLLIRILRELKRLPLYFTGKKRYKTRSYNLMDNNE